MMKATNSFFSSNAPQFQMTDELYTEVTKYIKDNNWSLAQFCDKIKMPRYMISKILNRKIKMKCFYSILLRIAKQCNVVGKVKLGID